MGFNRQGMRASSVVPLDDRPVWSLCSRTSKQCIDRHRDAVWGRGNRAIELNKNNLMSNNSMPCCYCTKMSNCSTIINYVFGIPSKHTATLLSRVHVCAEFSSKLCVDGSVYCVVQNNRIYAMDIIARSDGQKNKIRENVFAGF